MHSNPQNKIDFLLETLKHSDNVRKFMGFFILALLERSNEHDNSKWTAQEELEGYSLLDVLALRDEEFGSDRYKKIMENIRPAIEHHYAYNRHHPEWHDQGVNGMTLIDLIEMLADWKAATLRNKGGNLEKSIEINSIRFNISPQLKQILENTAQEYFEED